MEENQLKCFNSKLTHAKSFSIMDKVDKATRSKIMSGVKSKDTKLETTFRKLLWQYGIRYSKNNKQLYGKPDLPFKRKKIVIFIDSCYWHGCKDHLRMPSSNINYWIKKIKRNRARDEEVNKYYSNSGWRVFRIWEHDIVIHSRKTEMINEILKILQYKKHHYTSVITNFYVQ